MVGESRSKTGDAKDMMTGKNYSRLAALIFTVVATLQLIRAVGGWPGATTSIPLWASWVACVIAWVLASRKATSIRRSAQKSNSEIVGRVSVGKPLKM